MSQPIPPGIAEAVSRMTETIIAEGQDVLHIPLECVGIPAGSTIETCRQIADLLTQQWAPPCESRAPQPVHDWRVHYDADSASFIAMSRRLLWEQLH